MKTAVWDTFVPRRSGATMHFDLLVPEGTPFEAVQTFGRAYLAGKGEAGQPLTTAECRLCHVQQAPPDHAAAIAAHGFSIIEMENCTP